MREVRMEIKKTERGFEIIRFRDFYGAECSLQQSSLALYDQPGSSAVWLGYGDHRIHINLELMKALLLHLENWVENGSFYKREDGITQLSSAIACYSLMDQTGLQQLRQALESDLIGNIDTEEGVVFASMREQIIDSILEDRKK